MNKDQTYPLEYNSSPIKLAVNGILFQLKNNKNIKYRHNRHVPVKASKN